MNQQASSTEFCIFCGMNMCNVHICGRDKLKLYKIPRRNMDHEMQNQLRNLMQWLCACICLSKQKADRMQSLLVSIWGANHRANLKAHLNS